MFVVDTNVLLYAVRHDAPEHKFVQGGSTGGAKEVSPGT